MKQFPSEFENFRAKFSSSEIYTEGSQDDLHDFYEIAFFLEKKFFLNKFYINHIFKNITGFSVMQYIQYRRVIEAQKLLKYSDKNIINVCYECGFNSIQDFYRVFKKVSGTTPSKYKK